VTRDFRLFWLAITLSTIGDAFAFVALPLLVLRTTGSVQAMTTVTACSAAGRLVSTAGGGYVADRVDRRSFLLACEGLGIAWSLSIPVTWLLHGPSLSVLKLCGFAEGLLGGAFAVGWSALVPQLAGKEKVAEANAATGATMGIALVAGPAVAGHVADRWGPTSAIAFDTVTFVLSCVALAFVRGSFRAPEAEVRLGRGVLRFLWETPLLRTLVAINFVEYFLTGAILDLLTFYVKRHLHQSDAAVGGLYAVAGCGFIVGFVLAPRLLRRPGLHVTSVVTAALMGGVLLALVRASTVAVVGLLCLVFVSAQMLRRAQGNARMQETTPGPLLGRVSAAFGLSRALPAPIGAAVAGIVSERFGITCAFIVTGFALLVLLAVTIPARSLRG